MRNVFVVSSSEAQRRVDRLFEAGERQTMNKTQAASKSTVGRIVGDLVKLGEWRLIENTFPGKVIALYENGSIRVRLEDGRELDGWPERTKPIPNSDIDRNDPPKSAAD